MDASNEREPNVLTVDALRGSLLAGAKRVIAYRDQLDEINVFPVPDRDTGTNLAQTMRAVMDALKHPLPTLAAVSTTAAKGALIGAQGNSGVIFAQFFQGLREEIADPVHLTMHRFAQALRCAASRAREALARPREGTILTVISDVADSVSCHADRSPGFRSLLDEALVVARRSLEQTTQRLAELKRAGVVDAGALGFVHFLEGVRDFFRSNQEPNASSAIPEEIPQRTPDPGPVRFSFRYCTEAVVWGERIDKRQVMDALESLGDSVVVAGDHEEIHAHVHTNVPAYALEVLSTFGSIASKKVEDMLESVDVTPQSAPPHERSGVALVTDSVCDLPMEYMTKRGVHFVPVRLVFGDDVLRDRVDITPSAFYSRLQQAQKMPTTSQPSPAEFRKLYRYLAQTHEAILSIHISAALSGTAQSAQAAASEVTRETGVPIAIVDSRSASVAEGLVVWAAAEAVAAGLSASQCAAIAQDAARRYDVFVFVPTVEYFVKGGRLTALQGAVARALRLLPVLTSSEGKLVPLAKSFGKRHAQRVVLQKAMAAGRKAKKPLFIVSHSSASDSANAVRGQILARLPEADVWVTDTSPVIGAHSGPGGYAIAVMDSVDALQRIPRQDGA